MSKKNNVNPDHYKVAGREHMDERLNQQRDSQMLAKSKQTRSKPGSRNFIPGAAPVGEQGKRGR
jgi:hypothetical protein